MQEGKESLEIRIGDIKRWEDSKKKEWEMLESLHNC